MPGDTKLTIVGIKVANMLLAMKTEGQQATPTTQAPSNTTSASASSETAPPVREKKKRHRYTEQAIAPKPDCKKFAGIYWRDDLKRWTGAVTIKQRRYQLSYFLRQEDAINAMSELLEDMKAREERLLNVLQAAPKSDPKRILAQNRAILEIEQRIKVYNNRLKKFEAPPPSESPAGPRR